MNKIKLSQGNDLARLRERSPAWRLLASPIAPYALSCLRLLFEPGQRPAVEEMETHLAQILRENANSGEVEENCLQQARRELREWIRRGLITERGGRLYATDDLQRAMEFVDSMQSRTMTSTASRLATVQREIANLALQLSPDASRREAELRDRIARLENELEKVRSGQFEIKSGAAAVEGVREIHDLATSLHADFRRVEDSYRDAERRLRESLIRDDQHRGAAVDKLLDSHEQLVDTEEGKVFSVFHEQLSATADLDRMKGQLREIAGNEAAAEALTPRQRQDLSLLVMRLIGESRQVINTRARSDRDVRQFIQSGLAAEHHAVGRLLDACLAAALEVDFSSRATCRGESPLPLVAVNLAMVPTLDRIRLANPDIEGALELDLVPRAADLSEFDEHFWDSMAGLDHESFFFQVLQLLSERGRPMTLGEIVSALDPEQDLEAIAFLVGLAREVGLGNWPDERETFSLEAEDGEWRYAVPRVELDHAALRAVSWGGLQ